MRCGYACSGYVLVEMRCCCVGSSESGWRFLTASVTKERKLVERLGKRCRLVCWH